MANRAALAQVARRTHRRRNGSSRARAGRHEGCREPTGVIDSPIIDAAIDEPHRVGSVRAAGRHEGRISDGACGPRSMANRAALTQVARRARRRRNGSSGAGAGRALAVTKGAENQTSVIDAPVMEAPVTDAPVTDAPVDAEMARAEPAPVVTKGD